MKTRLPLTLGGLVLLGAMNTGCVSLSVLQEARTLPPGKHLIGFGFGTGIALFCTQEPVRDANGNWTGEFRDVAAAIHGMDESVFYRTGLGGGFDFGFMYAPPLSFRVDLKWMFVDMEKFAGSLAIGGRIFGSGSQGGGGGGSFYQGEVDTPLILSAYLARRFTLTFGAKNVAIFRGGSSRVRNGQTYTQREFYDMAGAFVSPQIRAGRKFNIYVEAGMYQLVAASGCDISGIQPIAVFNLGFAWKMGRAEIPGEEEG